MSLDAWSPLVRRQVLAAGVAPLGVSVVLAGMAGVVLGAPVASVVAVLVALIPLAYVTLLLFVLPSLMVLRRMRRESLASFALTCGLATWLPWWALHAAVSVLVGSASWGASWQAAGVLAGPSVLAWVAGALVYRIGTRGAMPLR